jgi:uracil phosphoribosyltransferase
MPLEVVNHPLAQALVTQMRDKQTASPLFRRLCHQLTTLLVIEATKHFPLRACSVETPLESHQGVALASGLVVVPVLRAGLGMVEPILALYPEAQVGHIGVERDHETALPRSYYAKLPILQGQRILIVDPMLATGGTLLHTIDALKKAGAGEMSVVSIIAAPEGVAIIESRHPQMMIHTAALDRELNSKKYIVPGIGDFGDRLMGTWS